jgi:hypothetical protein
MKTKSILLIAMCSLLLFNTCKKDNQNTNAPASKPPITPSPTIAQALAGKWFVVKDSIGVLDYDTPLPSLRNLSYSNADFVVFNSDSNTGTISSQTAYNALFTNYPTQFASYFNLGVPGLNFNYKVSATDNMVSIVKDNSNIGLGYDITRLSATSLLLHTDAIVVKIPHQYTFKQYIYLSK